MRTSSLPAMEASNRSAKIAVGYSGAPMIHDLPSLARMLHMESQRLFQITEEDLAELERMLPDIADALYPKMDNRLRVQLRRIQAIMSTIRWNYGPPLDVKVIPASD